MRKTEIEQTYKLKAAEMEREVRLKELEFKEKGSAQGVNQVHSSDKLKSKLPKFKEGDVPGVYLKSFEG